MKKLIGVVAITAVSVSGAVLAAGLPAAKAPVARVAAYEGQVMLNRGQGFVAAGSNALVSAGDQVRLASEGEMVFGDGCSVQVAALEAFTVAAASPCDGALTKVALVESRTDAAGQGGADDEGAAGTASGGLFGLSATGTVVASLAVVATIVVVSSSSSDKDNPASA